MYFMLNSSSITVYLVTLLLIIRSYNKYFIKSIGAKTNSM